MSTIVRLNVSFLTKCRICDRTQLVHYYDPSLGHNGICDDCVMPLVAAENWLLYLGFEHPRRELIYSTVHRL